MLDGVGLESGAGLGRCRFSSWTTIDGLAEYLGLSVMRLKMVTFWERVDCSRLEVLERNASKSCSVVCRRLWMFFAVWSPSYNCIIYCVLFPIYLPGSSLQSIMKSSATCLKSNNC